MAQNLVSKQVVLKCRFQYERIFYKDGMYVEKLYYSILRKEYSQFTWNVI